MKNGVWFVLVLMGLLSVVIGGRHQKPRDPRHLQDSHPPPEQQYWKERQQRHHQMMREMRDSSL